MKKELQLSVLGLSALCVTLSTIGCGGGSTPATKVSGAITVSVSPQSAAVGVGQGTKFSVTTNDPSGVTWTASVGTIDANGNYTAPPGPQGATATVTATSKQDSTKTATATVNVVPPGTVTPTANGQVALYTISPVASGNVSVQFGLDTTYGLTTWTQPVPQGGGPVSIFVAGMKGNTAYHMRGVVQFGDGSEFQDADQTFTTTGLAAAVLPTITTTTAAGATPQSGVELLDLVNGPATVAPVAVSDLNGNVLWSYNPGLPTGVIPHPVKLLPNGHFLINFAAPNGADSVMQEIDLTGNVIWQMTATDLNNALATACAGGGVGCNVTLLGTHHDFVLLSNGHLLVLAALQQLVGSTVVTGDVIIDLDQNRKPVWLWNEFDHLDINRRPFMFPDWTHTNALLYSADDGNLIISIRHQNWLVKIDYANGAGPGDILWKLGYQGDFTLMNSDGSADPNPGDWFFAQHGPSFVSTNTTGTFSLTLFDNGNDRGVTVVDGGTCGLTGQPDCYSTVPIFNLDENAKTATFTFNATAPTFSFFGGDSVVLKNGNVEYCEAEGGPGVAGDIYEVTQTTPPQSVWSMTIPNQEAYRGFRIPSLYPGVQW
ncbi:MAG TPA: aryl-sulfate sulfotransferase [Candidatus Sulfotelmatobacter sp.]|nr:aryl-sulfate sulfotransferase [Candidatus Sulfotelmatobacter sp.]